MGDLFNQSDNGALFSEDNNYRFALWRIWDKELPMVMFIGLNPSVANHEKDDPTIRRVKSFAKAWGYGGVYMLNLFTYVTPYPVKLLGHYNDPVCMDDSYLIQYANKSEKIIFAWGSFAEARRRSEHIINLFPGAYALSVNGNGSPKHPLYVAGNTIPVLFKTTLIN